MKRNRVTASLLTAATATALLSACSTASSEPHVTPPPVTHISAVTACRDFTAWAYGYTVTRGGQYPMTDYPLLHKAATEAPSGPLYQGMSATDLAVSNPPADSSPVNPAPGSGANNYLFAVDTLVTSVEGLCTTVNPAGGATP